MTTVSHASYDELAHEYYDPVAHPTCYNLNRLSRIFIERQLPEPWDSRNTLEVGAGSSAVAATLHARGYTLHGLRITDGSDAMLRHSQRWTAHGATLARVPAAEISRGQPPASLLVASLGDPYNTDAFWAEAWRAVEPGGRILFTVPSFEWSVRFRGTQTPESQLAEFALSDGRRMYVPSFVIPLSDQVYMMQQAGFMLTTFESLGAEVLHSDERRSSKLNVFQGEVSSIVWGFVLVRRRSLT
ncbi:MAG: hypothetical protein JNM61_09170 [Zoogloeaceae bacterium]|nr:hypothetical protein [Zoogloeaceae bacterium]